MAQADPSAALQATAADPFILTPLRDVARWVAAFDAREIPVLSATASGLEDLRCNEDAVDAHLLADCMQSDPLMTLKLLRHVALLRRDRGRDRDQADAETATEALATTVSPSQITMALIMLRLHNEGPEIHGFFSTTSRLRLYLKSSQSICRTRMRICYVISAELHAFPNSTSGLYEDKIPST